MWRKWWRGISGTAPVGELVHLNESVERARFGAERFG